MRRFYFVILQQKTCFHNRVSIFSKTTSQIAGKNYVTQALMPWYNLRALAVGYFYAV